MNVNNRGGSWTFIIIMLVLFWPIGLLMIVNKMRVDRSTRFNCGRRLTTISYVLMGIGAILLISMVTGGGFGLMTPALLFGAGGFFVYRHSQSTRNRVARYREYINLVVNLEQDYIDDIAWAVKVPYNEAVSDLQRMINEGYFADAYIDHAQRMIVFAEHVHHHDMDIVTGLANGLANAFAAPAQDRITACTNCGANNRIFAGHLPECDYCGSFLPV